MKPDALTLAVAAKRRAEKERKRIASENRKLKEK